MMHAQTTRLSPAQRRELERHGTRISGLGAKFAVCDTTGKIVLSCPAGAFENDGQQIEQAARRVLQKMQVI